MSGITSLFGGGFDVPSAPVLPSGAQLPHIPQLFVPPSAFGGPDEKRLSRKALRRQRRLNRRRGETRSILGGSSGDPLDVTSNALSATPGATPNTLPGV